MGRDRIRMTAPEVDRFLAEERVLRLATVDADGWPAVVPVWFVWHQREWWVWNLDRARRTPRLRAHATRVAVVVDGGVAYHELRGVHARVEHRFVSHEDTPVAVRRAFAAKYFDHDEPLPPADDHTWLALRPVHLESWDFRKVMG